MIRALFASIFTAVFLAALLTPAAFEAVQYLIPDNGWPFSRVFDRVILVTLIFSLWIWRKRLSLSTLRETFSRGSRKERGAYILFGVALSFISSCTAALLIVGTGELMWGGKSFVHILERVPVILIGAFLISIIEETLFRVIIFSSFCNRYGLIVASLLSSTIYSIIHFIQPVSSYKYPGFSLLSGFEYLGVVFERLFLPGFEFGFIGLLIVGMVLCTVYSWTRSVHLCIGLHTGWIIAIKLCSLTTTTVEGYIYPEGLSRRYFLVGEPIAWVSILIALGIIYFIFSHVRTRREESRKRD